MNIKQYLSKIGRKGGSVKGGKKAEVARGNAIKARAAKANKTVVPAPVAVIGGSEL